MANPYRSPQIVNELNSRQRWYKIDFYSGRLWLMRVLFTVAFVTVMVYEWQLWPNGTALLGPLGAIWYNGFAVDSGLLATVSLAAVFAWLVKPNFITVGVSLVGSANWLFWGVMAQGIGV